MVKERTYFEELRLILDSREFLAVAAEDYARFDYNEEVFRRMEECIGYLDDLYFRLSRKEFKKR